MKNLRKLLAVLMAGLMILFVAGCGGGDGQGVQCLGAVGDVGVDRRQEGEAAALAVARGRLASA